MQSICLIFAEATPGPSAPLLLTRSIHYHASPSVVRATRQHCENSAALFCHGIGFPRSTHRQSVPGPLPLHKSQRKKVPSLPLVQAALQVGSVGAIWGCKNLFLFDSVGLLKSVAPSAYAPHAGRAHRSSHAVRFPHVASPPTAKDGRHYESCIRC